MTILAQLTEDMKVAMKAKDSARLSAVRMLISAIKYAMVDTPEMSEEAVAIVLAKEAKKRRESIAAYRSGGREELAKAEEAELAVIQQYLPEQMSEEEVRRVITTVLQGKTGLNIGEAMKLVLGELKGKADGGVVARIVKELLTR